MAKSRYPFRVVDTFNNKVLSQHRSLQTAVKAEIKFRKECKRANNGGCVPTIVQFEDKKLEGDELEYYFSLIDKYSFN